MVFLRSTDLPSKSVEVLENAFRVLSFTVDDAAQVSESTSEVSQALENLKISEAAIVADNGTAAVAIGLAVARPDLAQSVALLSPSGTVGEVSNLKVPVLAMFGTIDAARAADAPRAFCRSIPNCRLVYVYDAGRALDEERPEAVAAALQDFAIRREGYLVNAKLGNLYP